jgi:uncharacterized membrane protein YebE (DUF533 family)
MIDANKILAELTRSGFGSGMAGGLLSGALAGAITGGKGNKLLKLGTMAAVGAVAYKAYESYRRGQLGGQPGAAAPASGAAAWSAPATPTGTASDALTLLRAMIAAAKADGQIDAAESQKIHEQLARASLSAEEKGFLLEELARPLNVDAVVAGVRTPQQAAEVYTASRLVIADASAAEQAYLGLLAARLNLESAITAELDRAVQALPA